MLRIDKAEEWDIVLLKVGMRSLFRLPDNSDDLGARLGEFEVVLRQLTEMPAAEWSLEPTQEH